MHSPGGLAEAAESLVELLRARFTSVRFIIPSIAKSAATMVAMSGDQLLMDEMSELGPTDPQMVLVRDGQTIQAPAQAIKDQFEIAQNEVNNDPSKLPAWVPILREYGPALLAQCDTALALSHRLVSTWLRRYMFAGEEDAGEKADTISSFLAKHGNFLSHARRVGINDLQPLGVKILDLRSDPSLREAVRNLYAAIMLTFSNTAVYKLFENDQHELFAQGIPVQPQVNSPVPPSPSHPAPPQRPVVPPLPRRATANRAERRRKK
jgi:hypothetical protein